jgi:hypothetical protein
MQCGETKQQKGDLERINPWHLFLLTWLLVRQTLMNVRFLRTCTAASFGHCRYCTRIMKKWCVIDIFYNNECFTYLLTHTCIFAYMYNHNKNRGDCCHISCRVSAIFLCSRAAVLSTKCHTKLGQVVTN